LAQYRKRSSPPFNWGPHVPNLDDIDVLVPNLKRRHSGVTSTIIQLVPLQAQKVALHATGYGLPADVPKVSLRDVILMTRRGPSGPRIWHARRNTEMLAGLLLRTLLRKELKLLFTSAAQRDHSGYTKWLIRQMDAVIATSSKSAAYLEGAAEVIRHGIDPDKFAPAADKGALRKSLGLPERAVLIGCFGRIRPSKGNDIFIDAMLRLLPRYPDAVAVMMGGVTEKFQSFAQDLIDKAAQSDVADRILILPETQIENVPRYFQALDLYIAPQRWEGFGLTPLEAMACAVPVVATRVGAFEELVLDGDTGRLIDIEDIDALCAATEMLLSDPKTRNTWAQAARARAVDSFTLDQEASRIISVYQRLLAQV